MCEKITDWPRTADTPPFAALPHQRAIAVWKKRLCGGIPDIIIGGFKFMNAKKLKMFFAICAIFTMKMTPSV